VTEEFKNRPVALSDRPFIFIYQGANMKFQLVSAVIVMSLCNSLLCAAETASPAVSNMGSVQGGDIKAAHDIIEKKCTTCHSGKRIEAARSANRDMFRIQEEMEKKGAKLNTNERDVLGIYWKEQNPLKKGK
jgi:uncharacterized membrane protein